MGSTVCIALAALLAALSILSAIWMWLSAGRLERCLLALIPGEDVLRPDAIRASRGARLARGAVLITAAASVGAATLAALRSAERADTLAGEIEARSTSSGAPVLTAEMSAAIRDGVRRADLPPGFLFSVLSACGEAQNVADALVAALRAGGAVVFAATRCGPLPDGSGGSVRLIVNQAGHDADARRAAGILVRTGAFRTAPTVARIGSTTANLIVLVGP